MEKKAESSFYFAYGSNINLEQMAYRCPAAHVVGPVALENYELLFRGKASGNGVATIAPKEGGLVHGLLWRITPACERALDIYEGYPRLYGKQLVIVADREGRSLTVMAYVMTDDARWQAPTMPSEFYYKGIQDGYRQNGLPVSELKKAWEHCAREVDQETGRANRMAGERAKPPKRRSGHNR